MVFKQLENQILERCYNALYHPKEIPSELGISQHFYWKNLHKKQTKLLLNIKLTSFGNETSFHQGCTSQTMGQFIGRPN